MSLASTPCRRWSLQLSVHSVCTLTRADWIDRPCHGCSSSKLRLPGGNPQTMGCTPCGGISIPIPDLFLPIHPTPYRVHAARSTAYRDAYRFRLGCRWNRLYAFQRGDLLRGNASGIRRYDGLFELYDRPDEFGLLLDRSSDGSEGMGCDEITKRAGRLIESIEV